MDNVFSKVLNKQTKYKENSSTYKKPRSTKPYQQPMLFSGRFDTYHTKPWQIEEGRQQQVGQRKRDKKEEEERGEGEWRETYLQRPSYSLSSPNPQFWRADIQS